MKTYELTYIISPEITSEEAETKAKEIESSIQSKEGTVLKKSNPVAKTLSYPIKKKASGFLGVLEFQIEQEKLLELKETIAKDGKIVRHMVVIKEPAMLRKERRTRGLFQIKPPSEEYPEQKEKIDSMKKEKPAKETGREKVELKDIEHELDELLGE